MKVQLTTLGTFPRVGIHSEPRHVVKAKIGDVAALLSLSVTCMETEARGSAQILVALSDTDRLIYELWTHDGMMHNIPLQAMAVKPPLRLATSARASIIATIGYTGGGVAIQTDMQYRYTATSMYKDKEPIPVNVSMGTRICEQR